MAQHKVGKSFLCSALGEDNLIIDTQHGYEDLPGKVHAINTTKTDIAKIDECKAVIDQAKKDGVRQLTFDNFIDLEEWAMNHIIKKAHGALANEKGIDDGDTLGFGKGRMRAARLVKSVLDRAFNSVPLVIVVAHLGPPEDGADVPYNGLHSVIKDFRSWLPRKCDHNGWIRMDEKGNRTISFKGFWTSFKDSSGKEVREFQAGSRSECWNEKTFPLPKEDPWRELRKAYE